MMNAYLSHQTHFSGDHQREMAVPIRHRRPSRAGHGQPPVVGFQRHPVRNRQKPRVGWETGLEQIERWCHGVETQGGCLHPFPPRSCSFLLDVLDIIHYICHLEIW